MMVEHFDLLADWVGAEKAAREFRKHAGWYLTGYPVGPDPRRTLSQMRDRDQLVAVLSAIDGDGEMTDNGIRAKRGHRNGPKPVSLPDRWYELVVTISPEPASTSPIDRPFGATGRLHIR